MSGEPDVVVVGAGPAGLAISCELTKAGVEHTVLERGRIGQTWRDRWDSFCLVTPNWTVQLPDGHYDGPDPDGFMPRDEMVAFLERYAEAKHAPVREHVDVSSIDAQPDGELVLRTSDGDLRARTVVLATGSFQRPHRPAAASRAARSPRSCTRRGGMSSSPAGALPGFRAASATTTSPGGRSRPGSSTRRSSPSRRPRPGYGRTSSRRGTAAAATST